MDNEYKIGSLLLLLLYRVLVWSCLVIFGRVAAVSVPCLFLLNGHNIMSETKRVLKVSSYGDGDDDAVDMDLNDATSTNINKNVEIKSGVVTSVTSSSAPKAQSKKQKNTSEYLQHIWKYRDDRFLQSGARKHCLNGLVNVIKPCMTELEHKEHGPEIRDWICKVEAIAAARSYNNYIDALHTIAIAVKHNKGGIIDFIRKHQANDELIDLKFTRNMLPVIKKEAVPASQLSNVKKPKKPTLDWSSVEYNKHVQAAFSETTTTSTTTQTTATTTTTTTSSVGMSGMAGMAGMAKQVYTKGGPKCPQCKKLSTIPPRTERRRAGDEGEVEFMTCSNTLCNYDGPTKSRT